MSTTPTRPIPKRRTARVYLDQRFLADLLALPDGVRVVAVETTNDPVSIVVIVQGDQLPEVEHEAESPRAHAHVDATKHDDGHVCLRIVKLEVPR